ncbi:MAG TPA: hypothetical protein VLB07_01140, partial [Woeseiaceae bacterium]|nr:hypothetical protein [Woeseiaceae bacterium]
LRSIEGSDLRSIEGSDLLIVGTIDFVGDDFVSVLGQTVFADGRDFTGMGVGASVAVYGSLDSEFGGIVNATLVRVAAGERSFLRGTVDEVNAAFGTAVISGVAVDYNALLSGGRAPQVGEVVSVVGRHYQGLGILVAE